MAVLQTVMWRWLFGHTCAGCGQRRAGVCRSCRDAVLAMPRIAGPDGVDLGVAFDGVVRRLILGLKYAGRRAAVPVLVEALWQLVIEQRSGDRIDVVTWAPTTGARRRRRGFDHAELLAREVAHRLGVRCRPLLRRAGGPAQTGRGRAERLCGPVFVAHPLPPGLHILVVDDVVTTGATLRAAGAALRAAGATQVWPAALAVTPRR